MAEAAEHAARDLPEAERIDYLYVVASLAYADRDVAVAELDKVRELCAALGLVGESVEQVLGAATAPDKERVRTLITGFKERPEVSTSLLADAIVIAFADGKLVSAEAEEIAHLARVLGMSVSQATLIGRYVESIILGKETNELGQALAAALTNARPPSPHGIRWLYKVLRGSPKS